VAKDKQRPSSEFDDLLRRTAEAERRLLKRERQAEKRVAAMRTEVADAHDRFIQAQERLARRTEGLAAAERELQEHRAARAAGPLPIAMGLTGTDEPLATTSDSGPVAP
jgi:hypothetical protein